MLEDYRKLMGEEEQFSSNHIAECMKKVTAVNLRQTVQVDQELQIRAYYAGHVIGAAMFYAKVGNAEIVYTGDYTMRPERHLGAAQIMNCSFITALYGDDLTPQLVAEDERVAAAGVGDEELRSWLDL